jgi:CubicO group peptidase (beta-lactamase class C family)
VFVFVDEGSRFAYSHGMSRTSRVSKVIDEIVGEAIDEEGPGLAVLVVKEGEVLHAKGYGLSRLGGDKITTGSVFDLASVSKHITATAICLLADRGQLAFDDEVSQHVPELEIEEEGRPILLQDLLWHISGIADYTGDAWDGSDEDFARLTNEGLVAWLNEQDLVSAPGVEYVYNNSGYALLARVVEVVSGMSYSAFVEANLFRPLGMKHTVALDSLTRTLPGRVTGYKDHKGTPHESLEPSVIQGDGNVFTCLDDLVLWDAALRNHTLITKETLDQAWTTGTLDDGSDLEDEDGYGYGFGWCTDADNACIFHNGSWSGTATSIVRYIDDDYSIILLSNNEDTDVDSLSNAIDEALNAE